MSPEAPENSEAASEAAPSALSDAERARLLARPELILGDRDLMRALIGARVTVKA